MFHLCDSIEHFRAGCPQTRSNNKTHIASERDQSRGTTGNLAPTTQLTICDAPTPGHWYVQPVTVEEPAPIEQYVSEYEQSITCHEMNWPVWETLTESIVRLPNPAPLITGQANQEIILAHLINSDTGAFNNLVGSQWVERMDCLNQQCGRPKSTRVPFGRTVTLGGVGKNTKESSQSVKLPTSVNGDSYTFTATVVDGSDLPAFSGMRTFRENRLVLDLENDRLIMPQPGQTVKIVYSRGTKVLQLERAPGGFLLFPCSPDITARV